MQQHTMEAYHEVLGKRRAIQKLDELKAMVEHSHHDYFRLIVDLWGYDLKDDTYLKGVKKNERD